MGSPPAVQRGASELAHLGGRPSEDGGASELLEDYVEAVLFLTSFQFL